MIERLRAHEQELRSAGISHLSLFGSVARGSAIPDSAVDLLAELDPSARVGLFRLAALERRLAEMLGHGVDLVPAPIEQSRLREGVERDRSGVF